MGYINTLTHELRIASTADVAMTGMMIPRFSTRIKLFFKEFTFKHSENATNSSVKDPIKVAHRHQSDRRFQTFCRISLVDGTRGRYLKPMRVRR